MESLNKLSDEQLVVLYAEGCNSAFDLLLFRYKTKIHSYISYVIKDPDLTEDLFQETFIKAIVTIRQGKYTETGKFGAWLSRIAHNLVIDHFRQGKTENNVSSDQNEYDVLNNVKLSHGSIEDDLIRTQLHCDVRKLIRNLPQNQQDVLVMRYYKNLSFKEIAETTGVSINTALGRMRYALINMRKMADEYNISLTLD